uniref:Uncharacterized protein n=1 Tax=Mola mola TaxID=94237 RepID=A0A3Q3WZW0_MOLML
APCLSPACQWAAAHLSISANPFSQPCDYFLFTCGSDRLSPNNGRRQRGQDVQGHQQSQKGKVTLQPKRAQTKERKDSELGEEIMDRKTALLRYLKEILLGGWAVSGQWNQTDFNSTLSLLMRDYATFPLFSLKVGRDPKKTALRTTKQYIQIDQPDLLIPIEWNTETQKSETRTQTLRPFLAACERYLALLGSPPKSSMIHVGTFISLSSKLAVAAAPLHYRLSKGLLYQRMTIKELQSQAPAIDWLGCLQATFHPLLLNENDLVLLHNLPYLVQMSHIISKWLNTDELRNGPLQTYMVFHLLHTLMPALDSRFSETARNLSVALGHGKEPRWKHCVLETTTRFNLVLRNLLSRRIAHKEAAEIIQNIFFIFKSKLHELRWTNLTSLQFVMKKVQSLIPRLWTTKGISSQAELDLLFSKLSVTPVLLGNELLFPIGMFVPPHFHSTYPAMNYGVIGFLIAKDILHLILPDHSQSETVRAVGDCVWTHYLTVTEKGGRGKAFSLSAAQQQEVWVQYSAVQIALQAYRQSLKNHRSDTSISGLSHIRLFLTSFAQVNCDFDSYREFMPLEPSFLLTVVCAKS